MMFLSNLFYDISNKKEIELEHMAYSLHLYFRGLSLRNTSKSISKLVQIIHTIAIRDWIQKYKPKRLYYGKTTISEFIHVYQKMKLKLKLVLNTLGLIGLLSNLRVRKSLKLVYIKKTKYVYCIRTFSFRCNGRVWGASSFNR